MKVKVHYIKDSEGQDKAVKIAIDDWRQLQSLLEKISDNEHEPLELVETPFKVEKIENKPKARHFSDFIMDI